MSKAACGGHRGRPSPARLAALLYPRAEGRDPRKADSPGGRPCLHLPTMASPQIPRARVKRAPRTTRCPQVRSKLVLKEFFVISPGHPGRRLPAGRRSSVRVAARSRRSCPQTGGCRSSPTLTGSGFPRARTATKQATTQIRSCFLLQSTFPSSLDPGDPSVQTFAPHSPHLPAPCLSSFVYCAP